MTEQQKYTGMCEYRLHIAMAAIISSLALPLIHYISHQPIKQLLDVITDNVIG